MSSAKTLNAKTRRKIEDFKRHSQSFPKTYVIYEDDILRLLAYPKPLHDQLAIELPILQGFRSQEICSWRREWLDIENGNCLVYDCKKKKLFKIPLNVNVAAHVEELMKDRKEGLVLRSRSNRNRGKQLTIFSVWHSWRRWSYRAKLHNPEDMSPLVGRRYLACKWLKEGLSLVTLSKFMRHSSVAVTLLYASSLIFYSDLQEDYKKFQFQFPSTNLKLKQKAAPQVVTA